MKQATMKMFFLSKKKTITKHQSFIQKKITKHQRAYIKELKRKRKHVLRKI